MGSKSIFILITLLVFSFGNKCFAKKDTIDINPVNGIIDTMLLCDSNTYSVKMFRQFSSRIVSAYDEKKKWYNDYQLEIKLEIEDKSFSKDLVINFDSCKQFFDSTFLEHGVLYNGWFEGFDCINLEMTIFIIFNIPELDWSYPVNVLYSIRDQNIKYEVLDY